MGQPTFAERIDIALEAINSGKVVLSPEIDRVVQTVRIDGDIKALKTASLADKPELTQRVEDGIIKLLEIGGDLEAGRCISEYNMAMGY